MPTTIQVQNYTGHELKVTGRQGDPGDFKEFNDGVVIKRLETKIVAVINSTSIGGRWDWIYLHHERVGKEYQVYLEENVANRQYIHSFGLKDPNSTQSNSQPKPLPSECWGWKHANNIATYTLYDCKATKPPSRPSRG